MLHKYLVAVGLLAACGGPAHARSFSFVATGAPSGSFGVARYLATADFNGDGRTDAVTSDWCGIRCNTDNVAVFLAGASGALLPPTLLPASPNPW